MYPSLLTVLGKFDEKNRSDNQTVQIGRSKRGSSRRWYSRFVCYRSQGLRQTKGHTELYRGAEYIVDFLPKVKIEVVLDDDQVDEAIEAIIDAAKTDKIGDGKIFVSSIEQAIRIRTRESGSEAL